MKAVILCGGFGSRMGDYCVDIPKPLIPLAGKPVLLHQVEALRKEGIGEFIFVVGYLHDKICDFFGDGSEFGVCINYFVEDEPLGTAGALFQLGLKEDFLLCGGDLIFDFCLQSMVAFHHERNALITLFTHPNTHPYDSTLIKADDKDRVLELCRDSERKISMRNLCNAGIEIVSPEALRRFPQSGRADFDKDLLSPAVETGRVFSYKCSEYVHDMGTPQRLKAVKDDILRGIPSIRRSTNTQRAVFFDRDGTLNNHIGYISKPDEIELSPGAADCVAAVNRLGFLAIVATNQPVVARGECSLEDLEKIHGRLEYLLGGQGAILDEIYFCPHHPNSGYEGEIKELKIDCNCRKPRPGMLLKAQADLNINLAESYMVGDSAYDIEAARNAGCMPVIIGHENSGVEGVLSFNSLSEFTEFLCIKHKELH